MDMKKLLTIVSESKQVNECGDMMGGPMNMPTTPPVSMSVNLNAQGIDSIKELIQLMHKADSPLAPGPVGGMELPPEPMPVISAPQDINAQPAMEPMAPPALAPMAPSVEPQPGVDPLDDLIKKAGIAVKAKDEPKGDDEGDKGADKPATPLGKVADEVQDMADTLADKNAKEEYANAPDEKYGDVDAVTGTGDDLASKGKEAPKVNGGGNPMESIRAMLDARYNEIKEAKSKPDYIDLDKDGNKKEPMKKAAKDAKVKEGFSSDAKTGDTFKTSKGTATKTKTGLVHTRDKYDYDPGSDDKDDKKMKRDAKKKQ